MSIPPISQAEQFTHWRQQRAHRHERILTPLWDQAVALTQVLQNGRVAKALGLSATDLKPIPFNSPSRWPAQKV